MSDSSAYERWKCGTLSSKRSEEVSEDHLFSATLNTTSAGMDAMDGSTKAGVIAANRRELESSLAQAGFGVHSISAVKVLSEASVHQEAGGGGGDGARERDELELELVAQRRVNEDLVLKMSELMQVNSQLKAHIQDTKEAAMVERHSHSLAEDKLEEAAAKQQQLHEAVRLQASEAKASEERMEEMQRRHLTSMKKATATHSKLCEEYDEEIANLKHRVRTAQQETEERGEEARRQRQEIAKLTSKLKHGAAAFNNLQEALSKETQECQRLRAKLCLLQGNDQGSTMLEKALETVRKELKGALVAKEGLHQSNQVLTAKLESMELTHATELKAWEEKSSEDARAQRAAVEKGYQRYHEELISARTAAQEAENARYAAEEAMEKSLEQLSKLEDAKKTDLMLAQLQEVHKTCTGLSSEAEASKKSTLQTIERLEEELRVSRQSEQGHLKEVEQLKVQALSAIERRKRSDDALEVAEQKGGELEHKLSLVKAEWGSAHKVLVQGEEHIKRLQTDLVHAHQLKVTAEEQWAGRLQEERAEFTHKLQEVHQLIQEQHDLRIMAEEQNKKLLGDNLQYSQKLQESQDLLSSMQGSCDQSDTALIDTKAALVISRAEVSRIQSDLTHCLDCLRDAEEGRIILERKSSSLEQEKNELQLSYEKAIENRNRLLQDREAQLQVLRSELRELSARANPPDRIAAAWQNENSPPGVFRVSDSGAAHGKAQSQKAVTHKHLSTSSVSSPMFTTPGATSRYSSIERSTASTSKKHPVLGPTELDLLDHHLAVQSRQSRMPRSQEADKGTGPKVDADAVRATVSGVEQSIAVGVLGKRLEDATRPRIPDLLRAVESMH